MVHGQRYDYGQLGETVTLIIAFVQVLQSSSVSACLDEK